MIILKQLISTIFSTEEPWISGENGFEIIKIEAENCLKI